jgi:hypothetical protein
MIIASPAIHERVRAMTVSRVAGLAATLAGWLVLALGALQIAVWFVFRPTVEYASWFGRVQRSPPPGTSLLISVMVASMLATAGGLLIWAGAWLRRPRVARGRGDQAGETADRRI